MRKTGNDLNVTSVAKNLIIERHLRSIIEHIQETGHLYAKYVIKEKIEFEKLTEFGKSTKFG